MKLDSIVFDCPFVYKDNISSTTQTIVAHAIDQYLKLNNSTHDKLILVAVEFNNTLFAIKELRKVHKSRASFDKLSEFLNEKVVVLEVTHFGGKFVTNVVYEAKNFPISI